MTEPAGTAVRHPRRRDIQGLRAVAVAMVVAFHAEIPPGGGYIGVDVFFVISGFVVGGVLFRELGRGSGLGFAAFYARRIRRLLPALAVLTTFVAVAGVLFLSPLTTQKTTAKTGIAASLFSANIQLANVPRAGYFGIASTTNALLHTWSLSVEEQFYLGFPVLLLVLWRLLSRGGGGQVRRRPLLAVLLGLTALSFALSVVTTYHPSERLGTAFAFYMAPSRAWEFAIGVVLALVPHRLARIPEKAAIALGVVGALLIAYGAITFDQTTRFPGVAALFPVVGAALLLVAGTATQAGISRVLGWRPVVWVGDVSYGWYLWHWPLIVFAAALWPGQGWVLVVAGLASLAPTVLSYRLIENPIRFGQLAQGRKVVPLALTCIVVPIVAFVGLLAVGRVQRSSPTVVRFTEDIAEHVDRRRGCDVPDSLPDRNMDQCTWPVDDPKGEVYLVGDSNAGHFTEPVVAAGNAAGYDVAVVPSAGCPFVDAVVSTTTSNIQTGPACRDAALETVDELVRRHPSLVIVAMSSMETVNESSEVLTDPHTGRSGRTPEAKAEIYEKGLRTVLTELDRADIPTLVVHTVPQYNSTLGPTWRAETCPAVQIYLDRCGGSRSLSGVVEEQKLAADAEDRVTEGLRHSRAIGVNDEICLDGTCSTSRGDDRLYRDSTHLSVAGAELLTPVFADAIRKQAVPKSPES